MGESSCPGDEVIIVPRAAPKRREVDIGPARCSHSLVGFGTRVRNGKGLCVGTLEEGRERPRPRMDSATQVWSG